MAKQHKRKFKGGVAHNAAKQSKGAQFGYLNLPKGVSIFKEEPKSRMSIDIMPYEVTTEHHMDRDDEYQVAVPGELWYKKPYLLHRFVGPGNDSIVCPSTEGKPCPICEYRKQLLDDGADWSDEMVKSLRPSQRNLYAVIPKNSKDYPEEPHIWDISQFLFQEKLNEEIGENEEYEAFPDLEDGYTLQIRFSEEAFGKNKFADTSRIDFLERDAPYAEEILDSIPALDSILTIPSYESVKRQFYGGLEAKEAAVSEDEDEDEEDDVYVEEVKPKTRPATKKPRPKIVEVEDEDEDEEDEEPLEKPAPAQKRTKKAVPKPGQCPHGGSFGKDFEKLDECDDCELWDNCLEAESLNE